MAKKQIQPVTSIFTRAHYDTLVAERRRLGDLVQTLDKAEQCGIECAMYRQMRDEIDRQLAAIQQHFMTPPPS